MELATGTSPYGSECADDTQATLPATLLAAEHVSGNDDEDDEDDGGSDVLELFRHANPIEKNAAAPSVFDVIQSVVNGPPPKLPETKFSKPFQSFVAKW